jgi:MscS family membrane protein
MRLTQVTASWVVAISLMGSPAFADIQAPPTGKCASPRDSVYTLLYWLQDGDQHHPAKAALCIDKTGLEKASIEGPKLAEKYKKVLDGKGLYVTLEDIPEDAAHKDAGGKHRFDFFPDVLKGITYEKAPNGHWMLTKDSRDKIPSLYRATFPWQLDDMVASFPNWMKTPLIGIQLWQLLGVLLLLFIALILNKVVTFSIRTYVKRLIGRMDSEWLNQAVTSSDKPIGGLVVAGVVVVLFPILQFPVRVTHCRHCGRHLCHAEPQRERRLVARGSRAGWFGLCFGRKGYGRQLFWFGYDLH